MWDLRGAKPEDGTEVRYPPHNVKHGKLNKVTPQVIVHPNDPPHCTWRVWRLIPVKVENVLSPSQLLAERLGSVLPPTYDGPIAEPEPSTRNQHAQSEQGEFGTVVNEVTVVTSTVTTHKRYRVEDA